MNDMWILLGECMLPVLLVCIERFCPRGCESPIETRMFKALKERGLNPICQKHVGYYRIDLVIKAKGVKIAIECDGRDYHFSPEQIKHDRKKDEFMQRRGWIVLRFTGSQIHRNASKCVDRVEEVLDAYSQRKRLLWH